MFKGKAIKPSVSQQTPGFNYLVEFGRRKLKWNVWK